jgi:aryl-alcohol dehydrogenase-like predicted oxidoreductase
VEQLEDNLGALEVTLSQEEREELNQLSDWKEQIP